MTARYPIKKPAITEVTKWNYHERIEKDTSVITAWIAASHLTKKAQAKFERALDQLRQLPKTSWHKPTPASVIGDHTYVIRFTETTGAQVRVFGHFFDSHSAFVMTFNGGEKDDEYYPANYQSLAQHYRTECDKNIQIKTVAFRHYCTLCTPPKTDDIKQSTERYRH